MVNFNKFIAPLIISFCVIVFYSPLIFSYRVPIPADTIVGIYHPFRDFYSSNYPNGIPFKNFLITDPVRQTYVWKELAIDLFSKGFMPAWNPYEMAGKPLAANLQSGVFYPFNIFLLMKPFHLGWSFFIVLQTFLGMIFTMIFLRNLNLSKGASLIGAISFAFSGFSISWLEWGNIGHTIIWLPLILFSIDKIVKIDNKKWYLLFSASLTFSVLAGHLQFFFYIFLVSLFYFLLRWYEGERRNKIILKFFASLVLSFAISSIQIIPTIRFILLSHRSMDQRFQDVDGWFLPWQNLIQFVAPDYFGNPATLNYFGVWNYQEFVGYIGVIPLLLVFYSFYKRNKTVLFFALISIISFVFALPTGVSSLPYLLNLPLISSAQPSRLIFLISFSLVVLCAYGYDNLLENKAKRKTLLLFAGGAILFILIWLLTFASNPIVGDAVQQDIARRNLILPTVLFVAGILIMGLTAIIKKKVFKRAFLVAIIIVTFFDLLRFSQKFTPFTNPGYLYPKTEAIKFIESRNGIFRVASADRRILAPNFLTYYRIQTIEGYDPLYLNGYAQFIASMEQNSPEPVEPYRFNRIITPHNFESPLFDFLNVKYLFSLSDIESEKLEKVFQEGETRIYENKNYLERTFFVEKIVKSSSIRDVFVSDLKKTAVVESFDKSDNLTVGKSEIVKYLPNEVAIKTNNTGEGFLVFSDAFYPTWDAYIDGEPAKIYRTNKAFRGIYVPRGEHLVVMKNSLF